MRRLRLFWIGGEQDQLILEVMQALNLTEPPKAKCCICAADCAVKLVPIPKFYEEAIASEQADLWKEAMEDEMTSLAAHDTCELEEAPRHGHKVWIGLLPEAK
jgi:hypothetical protein